MNKPKVFIVIPAYNEEKTLAKVILELKQEGFDNIVIVDDGSSDNTYSLALQNNVFVLKHLVNLGQGAALRTGIAFALTQDPDVIVTFDADGQHQASDIHKLIKPVLSGKVDVALGSRFCKGAVVENIPFSRKLFLKLGVVFTRMVSGIKISDTHNGLRALSPKAAKKIKITINGMAHASEILDEISKNKLKYVEVPVRIRYTEHSLKKGQSTFNAFKIALTVIIKKLFDW